MPSIFATDIADSIDAIDSERVRFKNKSNRVIRKNRDLKAQLADTMSALASVEADYDDVESERKRLLAKSNVAIRKLNALKHAA